MCAYKVGIVRLGDKHAVFVGRFRIVQTPFVGRVNPETFQHSVGIKLFGVGRIPVRPVVVLKRSFVNGNNGRVRVEVLNEDRSRFLGCGYGVVVNVLVVPKVRLVGNEGILILGQVHSLRLELANDLVSRSNVVAVGMRSKVKVQVAFVDAERFQIGDNLILNAATPGDSRA